MGNTLQYKGYITNICYSTDDKVLHGKIEGIDDLVTFESESALEIENEFHAAVDDYIEHCAELGKEPSKTYKGTFNVRIDPKLHRTIAMDAFARGISLNQAVENAIYQYVIGKNEIGQNMMASIYSKLSEISGTLVRFDETWKITPLEPNNTYVTAVIPNYLHVTKGVHND